MNADMRWMVYDIDREEKQFSAQNEEEEKRNTKILYS